MRWAIGEGQSNLAIEILKHKDVNVNIQEKYGVTALMGTMEKGQEGIAIEILKHKDVNVNIQEK